MAVFGGKIGEEVVDVDPQWTRSYVWGLLRYSFATFGENRWRNATV